MSTRKSHIPGQLNKAKNAAGSGGDAVAEVYKALKASFFYPQSHPLRNDIIRRAYQLLLATMNGKQLSLLITRNGLSSAEGGIRVENTVAAKSLARELFVREIQRLAFLTDLSMRDFENFLALLTVDPQKIIADGGMEKVLAEHGIRSVITNEIDISAVFTKRGVSDSETGEPTQKIQEIRESAAQLDFLTLDEMEDMDIDEIIEAMKKEVDDGRYGNLAGMLLSKTRGFETQGRFEELIPVVLFLINQGSDTSRSRSQRECAHAVFENVAAGEMTHYLLRLLENRNSGSRETVYSILNRLGEKAVGPAIQRLNNADNIHSRKALATALIRIGKPAVPSLVALLKDPRWYVVRGMLTILGEIGCKECVKELRLAMYHEDERVRKEAVRCLTKSGGPQASEMLIELLSDQNSSIIRQAIFSLGILKSDRAVDPLMDIINRGGIFLKSLQLKKAALQAIGLIGAKRVLPRLMKLAKKRYWLAAKRGEELKVSIVEAIGRIGDESSLDFLQKMGSRGGPVGKACSEALHSITEKGGYSA